LTGLGERSHLLSPDIDLDTHITDVVNALRFEDLHDVILVGHSYGGLVILGIADRATDRIGKLVYLDAGLPQSGKSLAEYAGDIITTLRPRSKVVAGTEVVMLPEDYEVLPQIRDYFGVVDPADRAWVRERLTPQPWKTFAQPLRMTNEKAVREISTFHIACTANVAHWDPTVAATARADGRLWDIDTGHDLMITEPEFVATALEAIAER
jgi:pimeloyl-ACP methyl ester carboxylesterase